jgi:transcriptional regulator with XRE-family HTH domain
MTAFAQSFLFIDLTNRKGLAVRYELAVPLGKNIASWRNALGMTQEQLAFNLDVDQVTISRFERGATLPSLPTLNRLAHVLGVTMAQLLNEQPTGAFSNADKIAAFLEPLSAAEQQFALDFIERFCGFLAERK